MTVPTRSELMTDSKARKVIVLENPLLPLRIKQTVAKILFEHLQVPSLSFALSPLCALLSIGRATGLVVDVGNLETCLLPVSLLPPISPHCEYSLTYMSPSDLRVKTAFLPSTYESDSIEKTVTSPTRSPQTLCNLHSPFVLFNSLNIVTAAANWFIVYFSKDHQLCAR